MTVKISMSTDDQQEAFDLLASAVERVSLTAEVHMHPLWWRIREFCDKFRDCDMITRELYLKDYAE